MSWIGKDSLSAYSMEILFRTELMKIPRALSYFFANADDHKAKWKTDPELGGH